jgi:acetolactate synthase-1/2/3 large subunit
MNAEGGTMLAADLLAQLLVREGVEFLPAYPSNALIESGSKAGIRPIIVRQERQALAIAHGCAHASGGARLAVTAVQQGPGAENAFGGVAQCYGDNVPVLHVAGGYELDRIGVHPNFCSATALRSVTKHSELITAAPRLPIAVQHALATARNGRPGPVALEVPDDVLDAQVDEALLASYKPAPRSRAGVDPAEVEEFLDVLAKARHPVLVAGQGVLYGGASAELVAFAEATGIPVLSTLNGKSAFPENHPLYLGCGGRSHPGPVVHFLREADAIAGFGTSFTRSFYITAYPTRNRCFLQVTNCEADFAKDYPLDLGLLGDVKLALAAMLASIARRPRTFSRDRAKQVAEVVAGQRAEFLAKWRPLLDSNEVPMSPYRIIAELMRVADRTRTIVTHDAGSPRDQITAFYEAVVPHGYIGWGKTTQLGLGLGLAQGARLVRPDRICVNFMGDAAIGMTGMDLETGVREGIATTTVVFKNSLMGLYSGYFPEASRRHRINQVGGRYADLMRALGGDAETVTSPDEIGAAFRRAFAHNAEGRPALIEFITREETRLAVDPAVAEWT